MSQPPDIGYNPPRLSPHSHSQSVPQSSPPNSPNATANVSLPSGILLMPPLTPNDALNEEISVLRSIYDLPILTITSAHTSSGNTEATLALPTTSITFRISFPANYPELPPLVLGTQHVGSATRVGEGEAAAETLRGVLNSVYFAGQVCLFDLIEEASPLLAQDDFSGNAQGDGAAAGEAQIDQNRSVPKQDNSLGDASLTASGVAAHLPEPAWVLSEPITFNKSTFVARCLPVKSVSEATDALSHLLATNKKVAGATHNIRAWRLKLPQSQTSTSTSTSVSASGTAKDKEQAKDAVGSEVVIQDCDDDGETAAGGRLLRLMQLMDVWGCIVVVTRWYGGVKLGADRFRLINMVAREAMVRSGLSNTQEEGKKADKKGKKR